MPMTINKDPARIGVVSDTHGQFRLAIADLFRGVDLILHAGDIGNTLVIRKLESIAPVVAVLGNTDKPSTFPSLSLSAVVRVNETWIYMLHDLDLLDIDPQAAGFSAVVHGHTHQPSAEWRDDILFYNPGSAGQRRFKLPVSAGILTVSGDTIVSEFLDIPL